MPAHVHEIGGGPGTVAGILTPSAGIIPPSAGSWGPPTDDAKRPTGGGHPPSRGSEEHARVLGTTYPSPIADSRAPRASGRLGHRSHRSSRGYLRTLPRARPTGRHHGQTLRHCRRIPPRFARRFPDAAGIVLAGLGGTQVLGEASGESRGSRPPCGRGAPSRFGPCEIRQVHPWQGQHERHPRQSLCLLPEQHIRKAAGSPPNDSEDGMSKRDERMANGFQ